MLNLLNDFSAEVDDLQLQEVIPWVIFYKLHDVFEDQWASKSCEDLIFSQFYHVQDKINRS